MKRNIKVGDRIYFETYDGKISSDIVLKIIPSSCYDLRDREVKYNDLITYISENGNCMTSIEDFNTLSENNPKVRKYIAEQKKNKKNTLNKVYDIAGAKNKEAKEKIRDVILYVLAMDEDERNILKSII